MPPIGDVQRVRKDRAPCGEESKPEIGYDDLHIRDVEVVSDPPYDGVSLAFFDQADRMARLTVRDHRIKSAVHLEIVETKNPRCWEAVSLCQPIGKLIDEGSDAVDAHAHFFGNRPLSAPRRGILDVCHEPVCHPALEIYAFGLRIEIAMARRAMIPKEQVVDAGLLTSARRVVNYDWPFEGRIGQRFGFTTRWAGNCQRFSLE